MIRKQVYLTEHQEHALKRRAAETGLSEAELVRRALDAILAAPTPAAPRPGRTAALERLRATWASSRSQLVDPFRTNP
ncbi:MAG: hypothetical protein P1P87_01850 [Trueperaceae bacterium]|nr:hypothetical protein [Trueperaceae bacterium]